MQPWKKLSEEKVYDGYRKIVRRHFELPDGNVSEFDVVHSNGGSAILALTEDQKIICFKQFRPGPERVLYELPGGGIEEGEEPDVAIARELIEETGYEADIEYIGEYFRDAYISGTWKMFVGRNAKLVAEQALENEEFGEVHLLTVDEFKEQLFNGMMTDVALGYAGLYHLGLL